MDTVSDQKVIPTADELVARATAMIPDLRARARECEELKRLPDATVAEYKANEFFRVCMPKKYGGYEMGWDVLCRIVMEVAKGCASSAWVLAVFTEHANTVAGFSDKAQAEIWADGPDVAISSGGNTGTKESIANKCTLTPTDGGYLLNGWATFSSGCDHATWLSNSSTLADGSGMMQILTPITPDQIIHNWDTFALVGTGSKFVEFKDCFIPDHRALRVQRRARSSMIIRSFVYRAWWSRPTHWSRSISASPLALLKNSSKPWTRGSIASITKSLSFRAFRCGLRNRPLMPTPRNPSCCEILT